MSCMRMTWCHLLVSTYTEVCILVAINSPPHNVGYGTYQNGISQRDTEIKQM